MSTTAERVAGERIAPANGIELAYDEHGDPGGEPMLLVMGLATQMIYWDEDLCALLGERGYRVIRFDNRDIGHSTKLDRAGVRGLLRWRSATASPPTGCRTWPTTRSGSWTTSGSTRPTSSAPRWAG